MPRISVILPVYNGGPYLSDAVDSVLAQDFGDFELLAINDGSTDGSGAILDAYADSRLRVIHQANRGLALTLRRGVEVAVGEYIARQDQDDVSAPSRFGKQVAFMDAHSDCGIVGSWSTIFLGRVPTSRGHRHPVGNGQLQVMGLFDSYFVHSSVMLRRASVLRAGNYPVDQARNPPEDFDLWSRIARIAMLANLPDPLLAYRELPGSISRAKAELIAGRVHLIACENIALLVGALADDPAISDLVAIVRGHSSRIREKPDARACLAVVETISARLCARFPDERSEICAACGELEAKTLAWCRPGYRSLRHVRPWLTGFRNRFFG